MVDKEYMLMAFEEAQKGVRNNTGGPFGAVVVFDGKVVGKGCNMVTSTNDPSAHAEIVAIREACSKLGTFHLTGAEIYASELLKNFGTPYLSISNLTRRESFLLSCI